MAYTARLAALIGVAALAVPVARSLAPADAPPPAVAPPAVLSGRITYPADQRPALPLPGGGTREIVSLLDVHRKMTFGDYVWQDAGIPRGPIWVRVDLGRQTLSLFRAGHEIGSTVILYGTDGKPTPTGAFHVLERAAEHRSSLYDAEMPYMLRLTNDGVAIHASKVRAGSATHGCIGVPLAFARLLFAQVRRGDLITIQ